METKILLILWMKQIIIRKIFKVFFIVYEKIIYEMINLMNEWKSDEELYANKCVQILQMLKKHVKMKDQ